MTVMKKIKIFNIFILSLLMMTSCHKVQPSATQEAVLTYQPWLFGHGHIDMKPVSTGLTWCVFTTKADMFSIVPCKWQANMEDLISNDNTPLDFHTVIITQIKKGKSPVLLKNYGKDWFNTNLYNFYCNRVRDYVSQHSPFDLMSNREILNDIDPTLDYENITNLIDGKVLNSLQIVTLVTTISDHFDIVISPKYLEPRYFNSPAAIWEMIQDIQDDL